MAADIDPLERLTGGPQGLYTYGDAAHLDAATAIGAAYTAMYDAAGNMTCRAPAASATCSGTPTGAQLTYDNQGRLATWQNAPSAPSSTTANLYDGEGNRVEQQVTSGGTATTITYVGQVEEVAVTGGSALTTTSYYAGGKRIAQAVNGVFSYLGSDGLGSAQVALDANGNAQASALYGPYGVARYTSGAMPGSYGFTGQRADGATGLDYYNARHYDSVAGQFTSADTADAGGLNRYVYVGGNPETATDPTGQMRCVDDGPGGCGGPAPKPTPPPAPTPPGPPPPPPPPPPPTGGGSGCVSEVCSNPGGYGGPTTTTPVGTGGSGCVSEVSCGGTGGGTTTSGCGGCALRTAPSSTQKQSTQNQSATLARATSLVALLVAGALLMGASIVTTILWITNPAAVTGSMWVSFLFGGDPLSLALGLLSTFLTGLQMVMHAIGGLAVMAGAPPGVLAFVDDATFIVSTAAAAISAAWAATSIVGLTKSLKTLVPFAVSLSTAAGNLSTALGDVDTVCEEGFPGCGIAG